MRSYFSFNGSRIFTNAFVRILFGIFTFGLASISFAQTVKIVDPPATVVNPSIPATVVSPGTRVDDTILAQSIKKKIQLDPRVSSARFDVQVNNGVVSLQGNFNTAEEAAAAVEDISATAGVTDINVSGVVLLNGIEPNFTDIIIAARIKGLFIRDSIFGQIPISSINIEIRDGVVYLSGSVDSVAQANKARELARSVPNVDDVILRFVVKNPF